MISNTTKTLVAVVAGAVCIAWYLHEPDVHTRLFCAYGKVFVEFEDSKSTWGTMFLDNKGHPIPCKEDEVIESPTTYTI